MTGTRSTKTPEALIEKINTMPHQQFLNTFLYPAAGNTSANAPASFRTPHNVTLSVLPSTSLTATDLKQCFDLIAESSQKDYMCSVLGWSPVKKRKEMRLPDLKYLLVRKQPLPKSGMINGKKIPNHSGGVVDILDPVPDADAPGGLKDGASTVQPCRCTKEGCKEWREQIAAANGGPVVAFLSFMPCVENDVSCLYIYEIHLAHELRNSGFGKFLMDLVGETARALGVEKTMLTVFLRNKGARRFYEREGYTVVEEVEGGVKRRNSKGKLEEAGYLILGKDVKGGKSIEEVLKKIEEAKDDAEKENEAEKEGEKSETEKKTDESEDAAPNDLTDAMEKAKDLIEGFSEKGNDSRRKRRRVS